MDRKQVFGSTPYGFPHLQHWNILAVKRFSTIRRPPRNIAGNDVLQSPIGRISVIEGFGNGDVVMLLDFNLPKPV